jgi:CRP-like cAMP-binding protein
MALLSEDPRSATVRATTSTEVYRLDRADFTALLNHQPDLRVTVEQTVRERRAGLAAALATRHPALV